SVIPTATSKGRIRSATVIGTLVGHRGNKTAGNGDRVSIEIQTK
ncbi:MAG: hypothetical protein ACJA1Q_002969, partial [Pseudohongiellaceae bacterium]